MNATELKAFIRQISKEKDLDVEVVKDAIQQAIISASKKNLSQFEDARPELDVETGELHLFVTKTVTKIATNPRTQISQRDAVKTTPGAQPGDRVEVEIDPAIFGRIAAQSARQVVMQKLKDAERHKVYDEYETRKGEIFTGIVQRFEKRDYVLNLGKTEALLPLNETPVGTRYRVGDRVKVVLVEIDPEARGPVLKVSRNSEQLVAKLFEQEVPEIADGTVKIRSIVREPGARTKLAVESTTNDVDPVGACVGVKGSRVQMIVRELENEKIDIVPYNENIREFIKAALVPAQIQTIEIDEENRKADVVVKQGNLSLAIGKRGQNAKLAARLTGWKLDIHSEGEDEKRANVDQVHVQRQYLEDFLTQIDWISEDARETIYGSGKFDTVEQLANADAEDLGETADIESGSAQEIIDGAREYMDALAEMTRSNYGQEESASAGADEESELAEAPDEDASDNDESTENDDASAVGENESEETEDEPAAEDEEPVADESAEAEEVSSAEAVGDEAVENAKQV
jgi:N utilization substance protein A